MKGARTFEMHLIQMKDVRRRLVYLRVVWAFSQRLKQAPLPLSNPLALISPFHRRSVSSASPKHVNFQNLAQFQLQGTLATAATLSTFGS
jgi:hypothetical protein